MVIDPGSLDQYLLPKGKVLGRLGQGWPWVYNNLLSVRATLDWLHSGRSISIPDDCRSLVERATHADYLREMAASLGGSWTDLWRELFDEAAIKAQLAEASLIDWKRPYREALVNEWLPTRLGEGTVTVAVENLVSPFTGQKSGRFLSPVVGCAELCSRRSLLMLWGDNFASGRKTTLTTASAFDG